ncbi:MAG: hypothetical protein ACI9U2_001061 [Bradymonadia bacterium]|jgi:hypothetical protein
MERMLKAMMMVGLSLGLLACGEGDSADEEPAPPLECGEETCDAGEYCRETSGGVAATFGYACLSLPENCQSCECVPNDGECIETAAGVTVSVSLP